MIIRINPVRRVNRKGSENPNYKQGDIKGRKLGSYIWLQQKHRRAVNFGVTPYVMKAVVALEKKIGRPLKKSALPHHIDGNKLNDSSRNLRVETQADHRRLHSFGKSNEERHRVKRVNDAVAERTRIE